MNMTKNRYEQNEIIATVDKNSEGVNYVLNHDVSAKAYGATTIVRGLVVEEQSTPDMSVKLNLGIAYDDTVENLLISEEFPTVTIGASDVSQDRRDVIEIRRVTRDGTPESRSFKDPVSKAISSLTIDTKTEYITEVKVLTGTPGAIATTVEPNWIKIAEILVPASSSSVINTNIFNVDAEAEGLENTDWSANITSIFRSGTISDIKSNIDEIWKTGVPEWKEFIKYNALTSYVQDEGMIWQSQIGANLNKQPSLNQNDWFPVSAPTKKISVLDGESIPITYNNINATIDIPTGDADLLPLDAPLFEGQKLHVIAEGSGVGFIPTGNGLYSGGVYITANTGGLNLESVNGNWRAVDGVTAKIITPGVSIQTLESNGDQEFILTIDQTTSTTVASDVYGSTSGNIFSRTGTPTRLFDFPFTGELPVVAVNVNSDSFPGTTARLNILTLTQYRIYYFAHLSNYALTGTISFRGKY